MEESEFLQTNTTYWNKGAGVEVSARGAFGGIGSLWNSSTFNLLNTNYCTHWILTKIIHKESGIHISLFNIYVPVLPFEKKKLLEYFERVP